MFVFVIIVIVTFLLARFTIRDTERARNQKQFIKDMENFDSNKIKTKK
tara:strand:- start:274 stop:417 length:144 start_codon:yes stop_codon:yes gene_type:complete